jgi:hypothetical protein
MLTASTLSVFQEVLRQEALATHTVTTTSKEAVLAAAAAELTEQCACWSQTAKHLISRVACCVQVLPNHAKHQISCVAAALPTCTAMRKVSMPMLQCPKMFAAPGRMPVMPYCTSAAHSAVNALKGTVAVTCTATAAAAAAANSSSSGGL